jgi:hypothetical protein
VFFFVLNSEDVVFFENNIDQGLGDISFHRATDIIVLRYVKWEFLSLWGWNFIPENDVIESTCNVESLVFFSLLLNVVEENWIS